MMFPPFTADRYKGDFITTARVPHGPDVTVQVSTPIRRVRLAMFASGVHTSTLLAADEALAFADALKRAAGLCKEGAAQ